jgi:hypothetical protein
MWRTSLARVMVAGLCSSASMAAAQQSFHVTYCSTAAVTRLHEGEGIVAWALDGKGIAMSAEEGGLFNNMTFQCVIVGRTVGGKPSGTGYCKYMDPDGDVVLWEVAVNGPDDAYRAVHGTGKWKGIKAEGAAALLTKAKPISPELRQVCRRFKGTVELPKSS